MKKMLCFALCVVLTVLTPLAALCAPVRDEKEMDVQVDERLRHMLNLVMSGAMLREEKSLSETDAPSFLLQATVYGLMYYVESGTDSVTLSGDECTALHDMFFANGKFAVPESGATGCDCVTVAGDGVQMDLTSLNETPLAGVHVYRAAAEGDRVTLDADVYTLWGYFSTPAENIPETDLTWWAGAQIVLHADESSPFGYTLLSYQLTDAYLDGLTSDWQTVDNDTYEYSVNLPDILGLADDDPAHRVYQSADGLATVEIVCTAAQGDLWADFDRQHGNCQVEKNELFCSARCLEDGAFFMRVAAEGLPYTYDLIMRFPAERQAEFSLYAELIYNSMLVWGLSNG